MSTRRHDSRQLRRHVDLEAAAWGVLNATSTAFVSPLLLARGAGPVAFGVYNSAVNVFGLCMAWTGPGIAARTGNNRVIFGAFCAARLAFVSVPVLLILTSSGALPLLILGLVLWAAGEGIALPLWTTIVANVVTPERRGRWLARRATMAAAVGVAAIVPALLLLAAAPAETALTVAFAGAALAGLASLIPLHRVLVTPSPPVAKLNRTMPRGLSLRFLGAVFVFWFGAALNRPVLPAFAVDRLGAPASYFALTAIVAGVAGVVVQPRWGAFADARGAQALLLVSGLGAAVAPLLWTVVPTFWLAIPIEVMATSCWLGHLLGLSLHGIEVARDESERPAVAGWTSLAQGSGAAIAPALAASVVGAIGPGAILGLSGLLCLGGAGVMAGGVGAVRSAISKGSARRPMLNEVGHLAPELSRPIGPVSRSRQRLPLAMVRALFADCPSCRGFGCRLCYGVGLE